MRPGITAAGLALAATLWLSGAAAADSIGDKAVPLLNGSYKAKVLYTVTGVLDNSLAATAFHCTSTERTGGPTIWVGIELVDFSSRKNDVTAGEGVASIDPGESKIISTRNTSVHLVEISMGAPLVFQGSARILSTSRKLICAAFLLDPVNAPPTFMVGLPVFKAIKQQGD